MARPAAFVALVVVALAGAVSACARQMGKNAAAGAVEETRRQREKAPPEQQGARLVATRLVEGAIEAMERPDVQARVRTIVDKAVTDAVHSALRAMLAAQRAAPAAGAVSAGAPEGTSQLSLVAGQMGRAAADEALGRVAAALDRDGALRQSVEATSVLATNAAVAALAEQLFPGCEGEGPAAVECRRVQIEALTRRTSKNVAAGVRDALAWPMILLVALMGVTAGVFGHWLLSRRQHRPRALRHA